MMKATVRWSLFFAALLVVGPVLYAITSGLRGPDGVSGSSPSLAGATGWLAGLGVVALVSGAGMLTAWLTSLRWGMFVAGTAAAWAAAGVGGNGGRGSGGGGGALAELIRVTPGSPLGALAVEGFLLAGLAVAGVWGMHWAAGRRAGWLGGGTRERDAARDGWPGREAEPAVRYGRGEESWAARVGLFELLIVVAVALASGLIVPSLMIGAGLKGQAIASAIGAGIAAATLGVFASRRWGFRPFGAAAGLALVAGVAPVVAAMMAPQSGSAGGLVRLANEGGLLAAARVVPMDWIAGMLIGVPLGLAWGQSLSGAKLTHGTAAQASATAPARS